eukprot:CAMPEP_0198243358 /NCGR_PEP_ID=MMETSP1446-20131203/27050_1 /TAXON_ID=1461542 ORGANISM="Unidentified sp, Strain CCMP2111" /NCGR_SAMPLE_ID=MMETSP1446 /ASSEMBLY_ACC=CAM_ASM_001112 /LENGTH=65 /DNA_ID=CAMNT_0043927155 /DNA_START=67 /DNA_END=261 /DNA_ORIENTATION=-
MAMKIPPIGSSIPGKGRHDGQPDGRDVRRLLRVVCFFLAFCPLGLFLSLSFNGNGNGNDDDDDDD